MMASEEGHLDVAQALLANGADVNAARTSSAALMVAAREVTSTLGGCYFPRTPTFNAKEDFGDTGLTMAA